MTPVSLPAAIVAPDPRRTCSRFVTILAWCLVGGAGLLLPVSFFTVLMLLVGSHGTANATWSGALLVVGGPAVVVAAGLGLWRRQRWAYAAVLALGAIVIGWNLAIMLRGPTPERRYVSPGGVPTTVLATEVNYASHTLVVAIGFGLLLKLLTRPVRAEFAPVSKTPTRPACTMPAASEREPNPLPGAPQWRVGHHGRDEMYYEEWRDGGWRRLRISGEMLTGPAHHVIYFDAPAVWADYPEWARHRRDEIIARIKAEFREPDYEYLDPRLAATSPEPARVAAKQARTPPSPGRAVLTTPAQARALLLAISLMLALGVWLGWRAASGVVREHTFLPAKRASQQRVVQREAEPVLYWFSIGLYATLSLGAFGGAGWAGREAWRGRMPGH